MSNTQEINLIELIDRFHSEERCRGYLEALRWPDGVTCLRCGHESVSEIEDRNQYECNKEDCRYQFSVTAGTVMHRSKLPLWKWFLAAYLMIESRKGMSANQLKRTLGVTYKTAWYLCHRIRAAMGDVVEAKLNGTIEVDETWVGGKGKGKGYGYRGNKTIVVGMIKRGGEVRLRIVERANRVNLHQFILEHAGEDVQAIYTDEWHPYKGIDKKYESAKHETVRHGADEWVRGDVHTNSIEGIWALLKRSIMGAFHHVSEKHLPAYLDELEWRFNNRNNPMLFKETMEKLVYSDTLGYDSLVRKTG